jgi:predicted dehydrogenase
MDVMRVAVVGIGMMGQLFARLLTELPHTRLCGVANRTLGKANAVGERYGVPSFSNAGDLLDQVDVDAVIIATDDDEHLEPVRAAAQAGKPILLEKPLAASVDEGRAILEIVADANVPLMVAQCVRFDPRYAAARAAIRNGDLGQLVHLTARRNAPLHAGRRVAGRCSVSMFLGVHDIDFMLWATGRRITQVYALGHQRLLGEFGVQDSILSLLKFDDGTIADLETSWVSSSLSFQFEAMGTEGGVQITSPEIGAVQVGAGGTRFANPLYGFEPLPDGQTFNVYQAELMHFLKCIVTGQAFIVRPEEALMAVSVAEAIDRSVASGQVENPSECSGIVV